MQLIIHCYTIQLQETRRTLEHSQQMIIQKEEENRNMQQQVQQLQNQDVSASMRVQHVLLPELCSYLAHNR